MKRILLTVAYDGTNYSGWQLQPNGVTVEEVLNRELSRLLREPIRVQGASRTDAGVHALGNLCVFDSETRIPPEKICYALNQRLPEDVVAVDSREVSPDFHPRKCSSVKTYEYTIYRSRFPQPLLRHTALWLYVPLDVGKMRQAAAFLVGEHDFRSFCSVRTQAETTVRRILSIDLREESEKLILRVRGTGFLYNMVRILAGTLIEVGRGACAPEHVGEILAGKNRALAGPTAPAHGLCLMQIEILSPPWETERDGSEIDGLRRRRKAEYDGFI